MIEVPDISYVVPVHNEAGSIVDTVRRIVDRLAGFARSEIILVENGSVDASPQLVEDCALELSHDRVEVRAAVSEKGMGNALRVGLDLARGSMVVLTAADLPFGFTDLDAALALDPRPPLIIGSKGHPESRVGRDLGRRLLSGGFTVLRRIILGLDFKDTQGTLIIDRRLARRLLPHLSSAGFLIATEIIASAAWAGADIAEVPVVLAPERRPSTVSPVRDGLHMAAGLLELRWRLVQSDLRRARMTPADDPDLVA